ncbi:zinc-dependent peptidase [Fulvivirga sedimenti]|uniref:Zinc-dependent peptidase n=1 Tax=Fulvivirga sedimenti TaxID=2879465 RepID=A0A9X1HMF6_9BACT|nr:zinc-dependent peptidase [Fulvivirga sedimenti]MCA6074556.1 zinc-dependent peptidase [Fulvivirga sedimenti]MCA6075733.1 zinc-dependent peptidase [Fulvivirga sedimenti]MCA6076861.1 zinc-dependent peptidase [Fulvivirga sedimenti]
MGATQYILSGLGIFALGWILYKVIDESVQVTKIIFNYSTQYRFKHLWHRHMIRRPLKEKYRVILQDYFIYYLKLGEEDKQLFEKRLQQFIDMKEFIVRSKSLTLSDEMIVLISASAIQLTFGFPGIYFTHFQRILIYPDNYYSLITQKYHQGEVNRAGIIVLSWKNFLSGYTDRTDGRNLALHEMAHALLLEDKIVNGEYEFLSRRHLRAWDLLATMEMERIRNGQSIFREYGATNRYEFFAVAIEIYFEKPYELNAYSPQLYRTLSNLLNQDIIKLHSA